MVIHNLRFRSEFSGTIRIEFGFSLAHLDSIRIVKSSLILAEIVILGGIKVLITIGSLPTLIALAQSNYNAGWN